MGRHGCTPSPSPIFIIWLKTSTCQPQRCFQRFQQHQTDLTLHPWELCTCSKQPWARPRVNPSREGPGLGASCSGDGEAGGAVRAEGRAQVKDVVRTSPVPFPAFPQSPWFATGKPASTTTSS